MKKCAIKYTVTPSHTHTHTHTCIHTQMVFLVITHCEELRYYGPFEEKEAQAHREEIRRVSANRVVYVWVWGMCGGGR